MFSKLRMKLVLSNVAVAGLIVLVISVIAYVLIAGYIRKQSIQFLQVISADIAMQANNGDVNTDMLVKIMGGLTPYFIVKVHAGEESIQSNFKTGISDSKLKDIVYKIWTVEEVKRKASKMGDDTAKNKMADSITNGEAEVEVGNRSFRYSSIDGRNGATYLIFLDTENEKELLGKVMLSLAVCMAAGLAMVFFGSLFLAGRSIRPIRASWQRQRDFVADASHELRSPLAAVRSGLEAVLSKPDSTVTQVRSFLEGASEEALRLSGLVDDMLLMARADSGAMLLADENVNIARVVETAYDLMRPLANKKNFNYTLDIKAAPLVRGDAGRLKQAVMILLDNAIKYTPEGGDIRTIVQYTPGKAILEISDTGIGIEKENLDLIFERFFRADKARSRESGGQGLGLSIAKWIIEKHYGKIEVESEPGKGSAFTIILPEAK